LPTNTSFSKKKLRPPREDEDPVSPLTDKHRDANAREMLRIRRAFPLFIAVYQAGPRQKGLDGRKTYFLFLHYTDWDLRKRVLSGVKAAVLRRKAAIFQV
jgi:hypothetical protein